MASPLLSLRNYINFVGGNHAWVWGGSCKLPQFDCKIYVYVYSSPENALGFHQIFKPECSYNPAKVKKKGCSSILKNHLLLPQRLNLFGDPDSVIILYPQPQHYLFKPRFIPPSSFHSLGINFLPSPTCFLTKTSLQTVAFYPAMLILLLWLWRTAFCHPYFFKLTETQGDFFPVCKSLEQFPLEKQLPMPMVQEGIMVLAYSCRHVIIRLYFQNSIKGI